MSYVVQNGKGQFLAIGGQSAEYPDAIKFTRKPDAVAGAKAWALRKKQMAQVIEEHGFNGQRVVFKMEGCDE